MAGIVEQDKPLVLSKRKHARGFFSINCFVPALFLATIVISFLIMMGESDTSQYINFSSVTGFFQQDDSATDPSSFDYTTTNFGLIDQKYDTDAEFDPEGQKTQWQRFAYKVSELNERGGSKVQYKVLYLGRHGEGYHNQAESYYGTPAWDCYWSEKDGNGTITWADAHLTSAGIAQALKANTFWSHMITDQKIPLPQTYYTSPLTRCLQTANLTFSGLPLLKESPFIPIIKELFREEIGVHTCDRRSKKSEIQKMFPRWRFEEGFKEEDPLWGPSERETAEGQDRRTRIVLDDVFEGDGNTWVSVSSHSGEIASILRVIGHREFSLGTGQVIPVLVKAERVNGEAPIGNGPPSESVSTCTAPPAKATS